MRLTHSLHCARRLRPEATAFVCGDSRLSWAVVVDRVARLAGAFRRLGLQPGDRVAILATNGQEYVETLFATMWAGGVAVPINSRFTHPEMLEQMRDAEPCLLVADEAFARHAAALRDARPGLLTVLCGAGPVPSGMASYEEEVAAGPSCADAMRGGDDLACLFYTGGTTGRAKGVMLSHANLWANAVAMIAVFGFDENLVHLHSGPLFHLAAAGRLLTTTIVGGCGVVIPRFSPEGALRAIMRENVTAATFVPTMLTMILDDPKLAGFDLASLRTITYGASPMPETTLRRSLERFPSVRFFQSYGMTELSPVATVLNAEEHRGDPSGQRLRSAGRPIFTAEVRVVDGDDRELADYQVGEIVVRGPMVMQGYWRRPELSREALRGGWMHTGDSGYFDADGYLYVVDRIKDMIITEGENVYSIEVENALYAHAAVGHCAVIGVPDERWGERVHAIVVLGGGDGATADELIAHCRSLIAGYKCPHSIAFDEGPLPLSSVNKVDKAALRKQWQPQALAES